MAAGRKKKVCETVEASSVEQTFDKGQIVSSARYRDHRDLVDALLDDGKKYTFGTVDDLIEQYEKGLVK